MIIGLALLLLSLTGIIFYTLTHQPPSPRTVPISVNYFFTRKHNYSCGLCFHTSKTSHVLPLPSIQRGLLLLKQAGMLKLNFAGGGEPFLYPQLLAPILAFCKEELQLDSVSITTNGSLVTEEFLVQNGKYIDTLSVSCDSFYEETNVKAGRGNGAAPVEKMKELAALCRKYQIKFKVNTVVNRYNIDEDMSASIRAIGPSRWKVFQVLVVKGGDDTLDTMRDANRFCVSDEEFWRFCERHEGNRALVPQSNEVMKSSCLLLDEYMRFLDKEAELTSESILDVGVQAALGDIKWDQDTFAKRGWIFDWSKETVAESCSTPDPKLEW